MTRYIDTVGHVVIVLAVIISATVLAAIGNLPAGTVATVYGTALGFTGGAVVMKRAQRGDNDPPAAPVTRPAPVAGVPSTPPGPAPVPPAPTQTPPVA